MKILHLCTYYIGSKVYRHLFEQCAAEGISQQNVFIPIRKNKHDGLNSTKIESIALYYFKCLNPLTRIFFIYKQLSLRAAFNHYLSEERQALEVDLIHAHTLYTDGFLAYSLHKKYDITYVLSIRTTDVSIFGKILNQWRWYVRKVLRNAKCVVFTSPSYKELFEKRYAADLPKTLLLPNGIDRFWLDHSRLTKANTEKTHKVAIYLGAINRNKNIRKAIEAFFDFTQDEDSRFYVIGGTYEYYVGVYEPLPKEILSRVEFVDRVDDKEALRQYFAVSDVLIMPSLMETFGLVYMEAVSQCVPVVYSRGRGIDGFFADGTVGFGCEPDDRESIAEAISKTLEKFPDGLDFSTEKKNPAEDFSWEKIAPTLIEEAY